MESWHDMAVFYATKKGSTHTIPRQKSITYGDMAKNEPMHRAFHCVPTITDLVIPVFIHLEKRHLQGTGLCQRKTFWTN